MCVNFIIRLTTCFDPFAGPSSGHKIYKVEKLYSVSRRHYHHHHHHVPEDLDAFPVP